MDTTTGGKSVNLHWTKLHKFLWFSAISEVRFHFLGILAKYYTRGEKLLSDPKVYVSNQPVTRRMGTIGKRDPFMCVRVGMMASNTTQRSFNNRGNSRQKKGGHTCSIRAEPLIKIMRTQCLTQPSVTEEGKLWWEVVKFTSSYHGHHFLLLC